MTHFPAHILPPCLKGLALAAFLVCNPVLAAAPAAARELSLNAAQVAALGIETAPVQSSRSADLQGLAAQVVVPGAQQRVVSAPLAGLVEQVLVASQEPVRKGQLLARLQSPTLAETQRGYLQALTQSDLAKSQLDRDERLFKEGIIAESRLQASRSRWAEARAAQAERIQALRMAGLDDQALGSLRSGRRMDAVIELRSPMDGTVIEQMVVVGQRLEAATAMLKIARLDPLWIEVQVPVSKLAGVREGALVRTAAGVQARVIAVARNIHAGSQTALVRAQTMSGSAGSMSGALPGLMPGQALEVSIVGAGAGAGAESRWSVPNGALLRNGAELGVFVRSARGFALVPVKMVAEGNESSLVEGAMKPGDAIVIKGLAALKASLTGVGAP